MPRSGERCLLAVIQLLGSKEPVCVIVHGRSPLNNQLPIPRILIDVRGVHLFVLPGISQYSNYTIATKLPAGQGCRLGRVGIVEADYAQSQLHFTGASTDSV